MAFFARENRKIVRTTGPGSIGNEKQASGAANLVFEPDKIVEPSEAVELVLR